MNVSYDKTERKEFLMLNVFFGDMPEAVYNTAVFFKNDYEDEWIIDPVVKEMIRDVDRSEVIDSGIIDSPVLGKIPPLGLSGGVKTLILVKFEPEKVFNASTCGDNCAKWLLNIAEEEDRTVNLRHIMDFGESAFEIRILNNGAVVHNMTELVDIAIDYI
jgi:hypothetical protein